MFTFPHPPMMVGEEEGVFFSSLYLCPSQQLHVEMKHMTYMYK